MKNGQRISQERSRVLLKWEKSIRYSENWKRIAQRTVELHWREEPLNTVKTGKYSSWQEAFSEILEPSFTRGIENDFGTKTLSFNNFLDWFSLLVFVIYLHSNFVVLFTVLLVCCFLYGLFIILLQTFCQTLIHCFVLLDIVVHILPSD